MAPSSWQWVNPNEYVHEKLADGVHTLIIACTSTWYQSQDDSPDSSEGKVIRLVEQLGSFQYHPLHLI